MYKRICIHLSKKENLDGKEENESDIHKGPVELSQLQCVLLVQGRQQAVIGQLEGEEDDWVQVQLED